MVIDPNNVFRKFSSKNTIIETYKSKNNGYSKILSYQRIWDDTNNILKFY